MVHRYSWGGPTRIRKFVLRWVGALCPGGHLAPCYSTITRPTSRVHKTPLDPVIMELVKVTFGTATDIITWDSYYARGQIDTLAEILRRNIIIDGILQQRMVSYFSSRPLFEVKTQHFTSELIAIIGLS